MATDRVIGREEELAAVAAFLDRAIHRPAALLFEGEAGVGKTTLWRATVDSASERSFRVLTASPAEAETAMSFAALGDLLGDAVGEVLPELPPPQRRALEVALLLSETEPPGSDQRAIAVAFLNALRSLSASGPVLVAVDDAQWLDAGSAAVLGYAGRRLHDERIGLLLAARTAARADTLLELERALARDQMVSIQVAALTPGALHRLLHVRLGLVVPRPVLRRIHETAAGNAFYALEIARTLQTGGRGLGPGQPLPVPPSLDQLLRGRIGAMPAETREALLFAACLADPRLATLEAALDADPRPALHPAIAAQLIAVQDDRIRFVHPLLASAAYGVDEDAERRNAHRRLAAVVDEVEETTRHLALAVEGPDSEVAAALERAAEHTHARGASAAAADLCEQAFRLTPPALADDAQHRAIAAARYGFVAGDTPRARALLDKVLAAAGSGDFRAEALVLLGRLYRYGGDEPKAATVLREALAETHASERVRADAAQGLAATLFFTREDLHAAARHAALAAELAARAEAPGLHSEALVTKGLIEGVLGRPDASATLQAAEELGEDVYVDRVDATARWGRSYFLLWTDEVEQAAAIMAGCYEDARTRGDESSVPRIVASLALAEYLRGHWQDAARLAEEGSEVALQTGQRPQQALSLSVHALVSASLGLEEEARADAEEALELVGDSGMAVGRIHALWALGLLELSLDRPGEVTQLLALERQRLLAAGVGEPGSIRFVSDEIEALVALGRSTEAERLLSWLEERGRALDRASALAAAGRCRGMFEAAKGKQDAALRVLEDALAQHARFENPFELGRTLLAIGSVQRRARRWSAARQTIAKALSAFEELGASLWVEKARAELARVGGRAPSGWELTATERQVAELVGEGLTNREVAARLSVTQKTVEFHLRNVFRKLEVRSRTELARSPALKD